jgi:putative sugar O-methyltransferase
MDDNLSMNKQWVVNQSMIDNYLQACREFASDNEAFATFKQDPRYTSVLEHLTEADAHLYFSEMKSKESLNKTILDSIRKNDLYGSPMLFNHSELGTISPTTVRYLKNSLDIISYFEEQLPPRKILEIGGGYGGLCKIFNSFHKFSVYYLLYLPEVNDLSRKYIDNFKEIKNKVHQISTESLKKVKNLGLVISNMLFQNVQERFRRFIISVTLRMQEISISSTITSLKIT